MAKIDEKYQSLCREIFDKGKPYENKNRGVERLQIPSYTFRHEFTDGFPAITNKKLYWNGIVGELIWFLNGDNDVKFLNDNGISIWNQDAHNWNTKERKELGMKPLSFEEFEVQAKEIGGSVGQNYSVQWRDYNGNTDQIQNLVDDMVKDIMGSRLIVNAWNPSETDKTALPPCHTSFQIVGVPLENGKFGFELHWHQRSVDVFLGLPFNIASYALLAKILEDITGYEALAIQGDLKCVHFYDNQYDAARELLSRDPMQHPNCEMEFDVSNTEQPYSLDEYIGSLMIEDYKLIGYTSDKPIKVDMLAPKDLK